MDRSNSKPASSINGKWSESIHVNDDGKLIPTKQWDARHESTIAINDAKHVDEYAGSKHDDDAKQ